MPFLQQGSLDLKLLDNGIQVLLQPGHLLLQLLHGPPLLLPLLHLVLHQLLADLLLCHQLAVPHVQPLPLLLQGLPLTLVYLQGLCHLKVLLVDLACARIQVADGLLVSLLCEIGNPLVCLPLQPHLQNRLK